MFVINMAEFRHKMTPDLKERRKRRKRTEDRFTFDPFLRTCGRI